MICDFKKIIKKYNMLSFGDRVVIGLSGGADSMTLLHLMNEIKDDYSLDLVACHVNHLLRGEEAYRDMRFVESACRKMDINLETLVVDVKKEAHINHESVEECGRRIRYDFFEKISCGGKIATAHNLCDNEETVILNLIRGTGLSGLKGISRVRGNIIRPLLDFSRKEIEEYCKEKNISFIHDSSNDSDEYRRNYIRHNILPKFKELEPSFDKSFSSFVALMEDNNDFINFCADRLIKDSKIAENKYDINVLLNSHKAVCTKALAKMIYDFCGVQPEKKHIDILFQALSSRSKKVQITGGIFAIVKNNILCFDNDLQSVEAVETRISFNGEYDFFGGKVVLSDLSQKVYNMFLFDFADCDKIVGDLKLRNRRPGDKINLQKRNISKTLKKLFCEDGIDEKQRDKIPIITDDIGVVWVAGYGCDNRCKADENSKRIISIKYQTED
ncbi:MAG: tRNA lysidine(34) synthetase TilS [Clostridia bacterium]|nr:tRNA lysidine(34) synthetase TilS [Clostridia bacterium]